MPQDIADFDFLRGFSNAELTRLIDNAESILSERKDKQDFNLRREEELSFYKKLKELQATFLADGIEKTIEQVYDEDIDNFEKYREIDDDIPEFGQRVPCEINDCWYDRNSDRIDEFDGTMFELMFTEGEIKICRVCYENQCTLPSENYVDFDEVEDVYEELMGRE